MKHFWRSVFILVLVLAACWGNLTYLGKICGQLTDELSFAQEAADAERWEEAISRSQTAFDFWQSHSVYLYSVLRHEDTDQINTAFQQVLGFAESESREEYLPAGRALLQQLDAVYEMERPSIKNIL